VRRSTRRFDTRESRLGASPFGDLVGLNCHAVAMVVSCRCCVRSGNACFSLIFGWLALSPAASHLIRLKSRSARSALWERRRVVSQESSTPTRNSHLTVVIFMLLLFALVGFSVIRSLAFDLTNFDARMEILLSVTKAGGFIAAFSFMFFSACLLRAALSRRLRTTWLLTVAGVVVSLAMGVLTYRQYVNYHAAARTDKSIQNLRMLATALVAFGKDKGVPVAHTRDAQYQPLLSWRVHLLEYIEPELYWQFHLDEPWNSPHNRQLISQMPSAYRSALAPAIEDGKTCYVMAVGEGLFYPFSDSYRPKTDQQISDWRASDAQFGRIDASRRYSANTLMIIELLPEFAVIWTKPDDLQFDSQRPKATLVDDQRDYFLAISADLSPRSFSSELSDETVRNLFLDDRSWQLDIPRIADKKVRSFDTWTVYVRPRAKAR
jgi:hypothetical protein